jgi:hypothetical protein
MRELLDAYEAVLARLAATEPPAIAAPVGELTISARPFATTGDVRWFLRTLLELPAVSEATVKGYEGDDRAIIEVRLGGGARLGRETS